MIFVIALVLIGLSVVLAAHERVPSWIAWLVPLFSVIVGYVVRRSEVEENRQLIVDEFIVIVIASVIAIFVGRSVRARRTKRTGRA